MENLSHASYTCTSPPAPPQLLSTLPTCINSDKEWWASSLPTCTHASVAFDLREESVASSSSGTERRCVVAPAVREEGKRNLLMNRVGNRREKREGGFGWRSVACRMSI